MAPRKKIPAETRRQFNRRIKKQGRGHREETIRSGRARLKHAVLKQWTLYFWNRERGEKAGASCHKAPSARGGSFQIQQTWGSGGPFRTSASDDKKHRGKQRVDDARTVERKEGEEEWRTLTIKGLVWLFGCNPTLLRGRRPSRRRESPMDPYCGEKGVNAKS